MHAALSVGTLPSDCGTPMDCCISRDRLSLLWLICVNRGAELPECRVRNIANPWSSVNSFCPFTFAVKASCVARFATTLPVAAFAPSVTVSAATSESRRTTGIFISHFSRGAFTVIISSAAEQAPHKIFPERRDWLVVICVYGICL